jgi:RNA polymerase sigma-70 factor (ECF subfamily)
MGEGIIVPPMDQVSTPLDGVLLKQCWPDEPEEVRILEWARTEPARFAALYERYFPRVYGYCLRRTGQVEEAEDLTSLVFTRALAALQTYRGGSVAAWLFRIAHNAVANHLRGRSRKPYVPLDALTGVAEGSFATMIGDPLDQVVQAEEHRRIAHLISALPEEQRDLLALRIAAGLSAKEVGEVLGKSEGSVRVALHRVLQVLRKRYHETENQIEE